MTQTGASWLGAEGAEGTEGAEGAEGAIAPQFFPNLGFLEILMVRWKIFRLLPLVKIKISNFNGKLLNLAPLLNRCHNAPGHNARNILC